MTIAVTGNRILDQQARRGKAEADRSARKSDSLARKAAGAGKRSARAATSRSRKSAGKAAARRGGRGIVIKKAKSGRSAAGLLKYASKDKTAKLILSNCGDTPEQQARFMRACASTNPKIKNPVGHFIIALPPGEKKSPEQWRQMVEHITRELGLDDTYPMAAYRHETDKGQDLHIAYSRVSLTGELLNDGNDKYLMASIEQDCEQRFGLRVVLRDQMTTAPPLALGEVRQAERTGLRPARMVVAAAIRTAVADRPTPLLFIERLREAGIVAAPYAHGGDIKGWSFSHDGRSYKGKDVSASWTTLKTEINYVKDRDIAGLAIISAEARTDTKGLEPDTRGDDHAERPAPVADEGASVAGPEPEAREAQPARPDKPARRAEVSQANPRLVDRRADAPVDRHDGDLVNEADPIIKKMRARQATIDRLRMETGERHQLAQELATRLERGDLYRQREAIKKFVADHADPQATAIVKMHMPELAPVATPEVGSEPVPELPERLKQADRYAEPTPVKDNDYQLRTM